MKTSLNWLSTHLDLAGKSLQEIDDLFTFAGVEVEGIESKGVQSDKIVVARIMEAVQHPNADKLKVTQVDAGEGTLRQIVCGARNYKVGDKVPCCLPGAELPGGFTIGETIMRGVESKGMLAAASEIGLTDSEDGIMILPEDAPIGKPVKELFDSDVLLELEVTPNRPDLLSHYGMARELAALLKTPLKPLEIPSRSVGVLPSSSIRMEAEAACPFYTLTKISGVTVKESPAWLKERLESIGLRPINNIVDVTNFVLHELGQPLHAFDAAKVTGALVVRNAQDNETFLALDGSAHELAAGDLVISDESRAVLALGGVMGGAGSGVTDTTTDILLESAYFTPQGIRRTSRRTGLSSDSSYRFERGADSQGVVAASSLAVKLILETAGGNVEGTLVSGEPPILTQPVALDEQRLHQLMGGSISTEAAQEVLTRLGLSKLADGKWNVPSFRADLHRHIDLVEEIARVHGLDNVPSRFHGAFVPVSDVDHAYDADMILRRRLAALGFHECQTIKLVSDAQMLDALTWRPMADGDVIRVKLPLSEDHAIMRPAITPGLVASAVRNSRQQLKDLRFFEMGRVFRNAGGGKAKDQESETLALLLSGVSTASWNQTARASDLYDLKGVLAALLPGRKIRFAPKERAGFALACDIKAGDQNVGVFARLLPARERKLDFDGPVFLAELDLAKLRRLLAGTTQVDELPQFPGSSRDAAMEASATLRNSEIEAVLEKSGEPLLVSFDCFDVFSDPSGMKLPIDRKSVAWRFHYRAADRTLKAGEVDAAHQKMLELLEKKLGVKFR
ncbi:MAG: phenylalanine--tRNA ligase subunit beta [Verrucomicrobiota bacterium]